MPLEDRQLFELALRVGALLLVFWALTLAVVGVMPLAFPAFQSASFFSHALTEPKQAFAVADLYFPANPFHSLANAVVPAVVLFSSAIGIALIGVGEKEHLLGGLRVLNVAIVRVTKFVVDLTPIDLHSRDHAHRIHVREVLDLVARERGVTRTVVALAWL
ncbi:MAG: dicarboxylate/amino acid:cation symporter, partial [Chloroflexi bacterium]|nr:dicarboxylate/amino acid:cation symporter [Chloroflexota bacterium]